MTLEVVDISRSEIKNEALKYVTYKRETENIINELSGIRIRVNTAF